MLVPLRLLLAKQIHIQLLCIGHEVHGTLQIKSKKAFFVEVILSRTLHRGTQRIWAVFILSGNLLAHHPMHLGPLTPPTLATPKTSSKTPTRPY